MCGFSWAQFFGDSATAAVDGFPLALVVEAYVGAVGEADVVVGLLEQMTVDLYQTYLGLWEAPRAFGEQLRAACRGL